ncbi:MAG: PAS domain S-box protein [bacterium]|nr:PAS domain S-box protein [bacterium]
MIARLTWAGGESASGAERDPELRRQANRSMARLAVPGVVLFPLASVVFGHAADLHQRSPVWFYSLIAAMFLVAGLRSHLLLGFEKLHDRDAGRWEAVHGAAVFSTIALWAAIACWSLRVHGLTGLTFFGVIVSTALCDQALVNYTPSLRLMRIYPIVILVPVLATYVIVGGTAVATITSITVLYILYLWVAGRRLYLRYWQALGNTRLLELRARELEDAHRLQDRLESNYKRIFENAHDAILVLDPGSMTLVNCNERASRFYGFSREELIGMPLSDLSKDLELGTREVQQTTRSGTLQRFETTHRRKDGSEMILEVNASLLDYEGKKAVLSINRDVTERKRTELELVRHRQHLEELVQERTQSLEEAVASLEAKNAELQVKNAEMERFVYTVSHDLKSPLVTIHGFLGLLEKDWTAGDHDRARANVERIRNAAGKMSRLLDDLLELSRIGRVINPPREASLGELAGEAVELVAGAIAERGAEVEVSPELPTVSCDRPRMLEVFQNLIENAVKFMGDEPAPRIEIGVRPDAEPVIYVRDNGAGIDPRYQEQIFLLFERLDLEIDGTGVGLALAKRIVEVHGGSIWVESEGEGRGATFCFTLPASGAQEPAE